MYRKSLGGWLSTVKFGNAMNDFVTLIQINTLSKDESSKRHGLLIFKKSNRLVIISYWYLTKTNNVVKLSCLLKQRRFTQYVNDDC